MKNDKDREEGKKLFDQLAEEEQAWFLDRLRETLEKQKRELIKNE